MRSLIILTEVYDPENFIINDLVKSFLDKDIKISLVTRVPSYPTGIPFKGYKNIFKRYKISENFTIYRFPVLKGYGSSKKKKMLNCLFQPFWYLYVFLFYLKKHDALFVYQTGSLYNYSLIYPKKKVKKAFIWSQDLWPDVAKENGLNSKFILKFLHNLSKKILNRYEVLSQSQSFQLYYKDVYKINSTVVYCFAERSLNCKLNEARSNVKGKLIYAGNIGSLQNLDELFSTYEILYNNRIVKTMDLYGGGSEYKKYSNLYDDKMGIKFKGPYEQQELSNINNDYEFFIFSLNDGTMRKVVPGRFTFCVNNNMPMLYIGDGEVSELIKKYSIGITLNQDSGCNEKFFRKIEDFRKLNSIELNENFKEISSSFDKHRVINEIHKHLIG